MNMTTTTNHRTRYTLMMLAMTGMLTTARQNSDIWWDMAQARLHINVWCCRGDWYFDRLCHWLWLWSSVEILPCLRDRQVKGHDRRSTTSLECWTCLQVPHQPWWFFQSHGERSRQSIVGTFRCSAWTSLSCHAGWSWFCCICCCDRASALWTCSASEEGGMRQPCPQTHGNGPEKTSTRVSTCGAWSREADCWQMQKATELFPWCHPWQQGETKGNGERYLGQPVSLHLRWRWSPSDTNFRRISPFNITPVKRACKATTCWYRHPFCLMYRFQVKENYKKGMDNI